MPFGFCHEMIKGFVVTGACRAHGTRTHSDWLIVGSTLWKGVLLIKTPLRDPSGDLFWESHIHAAPLKHLKCFVFL